jgi:hypothetical protein
MEGHDLWVYNNHISKCLDSLDCNLAAEGFFFGLEFRFIRS